MFTQLPSIIYFNKPNCTKSRLLLIVTLQLTLRKNWLWHDLKVIVYVASAVKSFRIKKSL